ncbi:hypothetical protein [uncultured Alteromonas sp.]|nr:hypothetical protein [uncultured Alteromonas sp.]
MNNTEKNPATPDHKPGIFNWFARYEESAHPSEYEVNLSASEKQEAD